MRRHVNLCGLGAVLLISACSGDTFTSVAAKPSDSGTSAGGHENGGAPSNGGSSGQTNGGSGGATTTTGGATGSGGATTEAGVAGGSAAGGGFTVEAGVADASGPKTWCTGQKALFCEDFDRYSDISDIENAPGYTYSLVGGQFSFASDGSVPSKPNALRVLSTVRTDVKTLLANTLSPFDSLPNGIRVEFTLRINRAENLGILAGAAFVALLNGREVADGGVALAISSVGAPELRLVYVEPTPTDAAPGFDSLAAQGAFPNLNQWIGRYAIDIHYAGAGAARSGCAQLLAGGAPLLAKCLALPASLSSPKQVTLVLGLYSAGFFSNSGDLEVELDNVIVTAS